jgi:hypothetical protein
LSIRNLGGGWLGLSRSVPTPTVDLDEDEDEEEEGEEDPSVPVPPTKAPEYACPLHVWELELDVCPVTEFTQPPPPTGLVVPELAYLPPGTTKKTDT